MTAHRLLPGRRLPRSLAPLAVAVLAAASLAGCGLFSRAEIEYYALEPIAPAGTPAGAVAGAGALPLGLAAIELPPGLDRQEIALRGENGRLEVRGTELWAAPLATMVLHTLAFDLADRLPEGAVVLPGQTVPAGGVRSLDVVFEELAAGPEEVVVLEARWALRPAAGGAAAGGGDGAGAGGGARLAGRERITEPMGSLDSAEVAAATSRALARLADRLVEQIVNGPAVAGPAL